MLRTTQTPAERADGDDQRLVLAADEAQPLTQRFQRRFITQSRQGVNCL